MLNEVIARRAEGAACGGAGFVHDKVSPTTFPIAISLIFRIRLAHDLERLRSDLGSKLQLSSSTEAEQTATNSSLSTVRAELAELRQAHSAQEALVTELERVKAKLEAEIAEGADEKSMINMGGLEEIVAKLEAEVARLKRKVTAEMEGRQADLGQWEAEKQVNNSQWPLNRSC